MNCRASGKLWSELMMQVDMKDELRCEKVVCCEVLQSFIGCE